MGVALLQASEVFRASFERCDTAFTRFGGGFSLVSAIQADSRSSQLAQTSVAQPTLVALEIALAALWRSLGVSPVAVIGHSVGEIAAACVASIISPEEAMRIVMHRSRLMAGAPKGGAMAALRLARPQAEALIAATPGLELAAVNSGEFCVVAGPREVVETALQGTHGRLLDVEHAFHSSAMDEASAEQP